MAAGLPGNHIYGTATDRLGYLWIATPKGVVRYNGYSYTLFNMNKGLPTDDNWFLFEDSIGRMWLSNTSHELGYIRNGRYHSVIKDHLYSFYFTSMMRYKDGFVAINKGAWPENTWDIVSYYNDSLKITPLNIPYSSLLLLNERGLLLGFKENVNNFIGRQTDTGFTCLPAGYYNLNYYITLTAQSILYRNYICTYEEQHLYVTAIDIDSRRVKRLPCPDGIRYAYTYIMGDLLYLIGTHCVYVYDSLLQIQEQYSLAQLTNNEKRSETSPFIYRRYPLWGITSGTFDNGLYIMPDSSSGFLPEKKQALKGYRYLGNITGKQGYWWHKAGRRLMLYKADGSPTTRELPDIRRLWHFLPYNTDSALLIAEGSTYWLSLHSLKAAKYIFNDTRRIQAGTMAGKDTFFLLTAGIPQYLLRRTPHGHITLGKVPHKYKNMVYDPHRKGVWLYNHQQLTFYDINAHTFRNFNRAAVRGLGLRSIEQLVVDQVHGNIFIKDYDRAFLFDEKQPKTTALFPRIKCYEGILLAEGGKLLLAGRFGLLCSDVTGKGRLENVVLHQNIKQVYYESVYDIQLLDNEVVLNTDKGVYKVILRAASRALLPQKETHRFVVYTEQDASVVRNGDTLMLAAGTTALLPDVINPRGSGKLAFSFYKSNGEKEHTFPEGGEMSLAGMKPDVYHAVRLKANDQVWQSEDLTLYLYLKPYWWQTTWFRYLGILASLVLTGSVIYVAVRITMRRQLRRQHMLEMGLSGVHAQINPHFIFNSLTATQYFIKANRGDEAYKHISRFSKLLRTFLRASDERYVTIGAEIRHLENYIELQQIRFAERFNYAIILAPEVDPERQIPSLLMQPLVENAIQHGLFNKPGKGNLIISFSMENSNCLAIIIDDDGVGREKAGQIRAAQKTKSYGTGLIEKLIYIYEKHDKLKILLRYTDKALPETGTSLEIKIIYP